ncbi:hypothetical protein PVAR5_2361 [Paecilomyces variotii No. 5]|uniref:Uncharacterized protein n=1 Tax=Byssochlamys spectabilis (strain No. 5 / NBRC 109023) TaxID=1356009 RepID=V5FVK0_BYSSN|nr:hypothetical protein PVAR5_2361 [Paecilomyces variotii No. 5]
MNEDKRPNERRSLPWSFFSGARDRSGRGENQDEINSSTGAPLERQTPPCEHLPSPPPTPSRPRRAAPRGRRAVVCRLPTILEEPSVTYDSRPSESEPTRKRKHAPAGTGRRPWPIYTVPDPSRVGEGIRTRRSDPQMHSPRPPVPLRERNRCQPLLGPADPGLTVRTFITERPDPFASNPFRPRGAPRNHTSSYFSKHLDFLGATPELPFRPSGVPIPGRPGPVITPAGPRNSSGVRRGDAGPPPRPNLRHAGPPIRSAPPPPPPPPPPTPAPAQNEPSLIARRSGKKMPSRYRGGQPKDGGQ